jgi:hypothetical protein
MIDLPPGEIDETLHAALRAVGAFTGCGRAYLFAVDGDVLRNTHEWCAPGVRPSIDRLQAVPASGRTSIKGVWSVTKRFFPLASFSSRCSHGHCSGSETRR